MKKLVIPFLLLVFAFGFTGCLKKIEEVDQQTTNIFDREYTGEQWFVIDEFFQYTNELGQIRVRVELVVPDENTPVLKASDFDSQIQADGFDEAVVIFNLRTDGSYGVGIDLVYGGVGEYCVTVGIYLEDEETVINSFTDCFTL